MLFLGSILVFLLFFLSPSSYAADNATEAAVPDKSLYTLFSPTPDDQMRNFSPDRPTKLNGPYTVDAGHFQYDGDFGIFSYDRYSDVKSTTSNFVFADPTLKIGLTNDTDFELVLTPYILNVTQYRESGEKSTAAGYGDTYARVKYNLFGNDGGDYALALVPYVKAPTASHLVGNQHWEGGGYAPLQITLPEAWTLTLQTELDVLENLDLSGMHENYQNAASVAHALFYDNLTAAFDLWSLVDGEKDAHKQYTADFSLAWTIKDNLQVDGGMNVGLNKAAPDLQPYLGIAQRF